MRIVFQGDMTAKQIGEKVQEMVTNTFEKAGIKGKKYPLHNVLVEFTLNIEGSDEPQLLVDEERGHSMFTIHTGIEKGKLTDYVPVDRKELVEKFDRMVDNAMNEEENKDKSDDTILQ